MKFEISLPLLSMISTVYSIKTSINYYEYANTQYIQCVISLIASTDGVLHQTFGNRYSEERFCGTLVAAVKSRVYDSANLSVLMYQQQLLHMARMFN